MRVGSSKRKAVRETFLPYVKNCYQIEIETQNNSQETLFFFC